MLEIILSALILGLSTGTSCLVLCAPFYLPYLISEERKLKINFLQFGQLLLGRLAGYLAFGLFFGYLGEKIKIGWVDFLSNLSLGILAFLIILYALNFFKTEFRPLVCFHRFKRVKLPFWIGLFTGVNLCPPFLFSLNYVFVLGDVLRGLVYFFFFFLATNVYFLPLIFLGKLSYFREFQKFSRWAMLIVGFIFFTYAIYSLITNQSILHYISWTF